VTLHIESLLRIQWSKLLCGDSGTWAKYPICERLAMEKFSWLYPKESGPCGRQRTRWSDYISNMAWSRLAV